MQATAEILGAKSLISAAPREDGRATEASAVPHSLTSLLTVLAISGLLELSLQRIVYRIGVHIPREGAFLELYRVATVAGDFAFRTTAVLLAVAVGLALVWLLSRGYYATAGLLGGLATANLLAWPLSVDGAPRIAPILFVFGAAWLCGQLVSRRSLTPLVLATVMAATALALSQYRAGMAALGGDIPYLADIQLLSEAAVVATAVLVALAAGRRPLQLKTVAVSVLITLALVVSYAREPATVAIVSLWATGVTMSLPGVLYIAGFGALVFAILCWSRDVRTRHLAIALVLLTVAGLQPQALHHGMTALLGLTLLSTGEGSLTGTKTRMEVANET